MVGRILTMSLEARMRTVARQEIAAAPGHAVPDVGALQEQITDLHRELHAVATRVTELEKQAEPKTGTAEPAPGAIPRAGRPRKATSE